MVLLYEPHQTKQVQMANAGDEEMQHSFRNNYNVRDVYVQKTKPKGAGKTGKFRLFYDRKKQRYYNIDSLGKYPSGLAMKVIDTVSLSLPQALVASSEYVPTFSPEPLLIAKMLRPNSSVFHLNRVFLIFIYNCR